MNSPYIVAKGIKWNGLDVLTATLPADEVADHLPTFSRGPFGDGADQNDYLEVVSRDPFGEDRRSIPVATVSKRYALLQHTELVSQIVDALDGLDGVLRQDEAKVYLSAYGERLACSVYFKRLAIDPGDNHPISLRLFLRNSVDGSCAFEVSLRWFRQVCSNGMTVLTKQDQLREIHHLDRMSSMAFREFLESRLPKSLEQASVFREWCSINVTRDRLRAWICGRVQKEWGPHAAARAYHICSTGYDGRVGRPSAKKKILPDELFVSSDTLVPGAVVPARSLYHVYQSLTWIANHRTSIEERETWGIAALGLARALAKNL